MILVTGGTGNIGSVLVERLAGRSYRFRVLVRDVRKVTQLGSNIDRAIGDLDKPDTLLPAMHDVDQLFMLTPVTAQVTNLVAAAKQANVRHVVKISTIEAGFHPPIGNGVWHHEQEELVKASGLRWTILRPTMVMMNTIGWWANTIKTQGAVYFPGGEGRVSPIATEDIVEVACAALTQPEHEGHAYDLTGPDVLSIGEMVQTISRVLGKPVEYVDVSDSAAAEWLNKSAADLPQYVKDGLLEVLKALRANRFAYTTSDVKDTIGHLPKSFEEWCRNNKSAFQ